MIALVNGVPVGIESIKVVIKKMLKTVNKHRKKTRERFISLTPYMICFSEIKQKPIHTIPNMIENLNFRPSKSSGVGRSQLARISNTGDVAIAPTAESFASVQNQVFNHVGYKAHRKWYLHNIITSDSPNEAISYTEPEENKLRKVHSIKLANTQDLKIEYTNDNTVKKLLAPIGDDQTPQPI